MGLTGPTRPNGLQPRPPTTTGAASATTATTATTPTATTTPGGATAPVDAFNRVTGGGGLALPDVLLEHGNVRVVHGTDPGDYYCEHMFFTTQKAAAQLGGSVAANKAGEKLVGFLHIPSDEFTYQDNASYTQAARHAGTREVIGDALRGYVDDARAKARPNDPIRVMLNGYGTFMSTVNNPTGDFVKHRENIDAAMAHGFGDLLVTPEGKSLGTDPSGAQLWQYVVREPNSRALRTVQVRAQEWPVTDDTIGGGAVGSVQAAMTAFKPNAVLSMGVGTPNFTAEWHADNGGMRRVGALNKHDDSASPTENLPDNRSLARAIHQGAAAAKLNHAPPVG